jgi:hypothetical protein
VGLVDIELKGIEEEGVEIVGENAGEVAKLPDPKTTKTPPALKSPLG